MRNLGRLLLLVFVFGLSGNVLAQVDDANDYQYVLIEAAKQKNLGNINEAIKLYKLVLDNKADCAVAGYELGSLYLAKNQYQSAEGALEIAYKLEPLNYWYLTAYTQSLVLNSKFKIARKVISSALKEAENKVELKFQLANIYVAEGSYRKAIKILTGIEKEKGFSDKVTLLLADIYVRNADYVSALGEMDRLIEYFPEASQFYIMAAEISEKGGLAARSILYYHEAFDIDSSNIYAVTNLADYYREKSDVKNSLYFLKYSFYNSSIDLKRKLSILSFYLMNDTLEISYRNDINALFSALKTTYPENSDISLMQVDYLIDLGEYENAYYLLKPVLFSSVRNYNVWLQGIGLASYVNDNKELIVTAEKALEQFPDSLMVKYYLTIGLYQEKEYDKVVLLVDSVVDDMFSNAKVLHQMKIIQAEALNSLGLYARSDSLFELLLNEDPDNLVLLNNYAYYLSERAVNLDKALEYSEHTILLDKNNATFLDTYAWILYKLDRKEEAYIYILLAMKNGGDGDGDVLSHAGYIAEDLGLYQVALGYFTNAVSLGMDDDVLLKKIDILTSLLNSEN